MRRGRPELQVLLAPFQVEPRELRDGVVQGRCADVVGEDSSRRRRVAFLHFMDVLTLRRAVAAVVWSQRGAQ